MERILITNSKGISYAGNAVFGSLEQEYIVISPSEKSAVCVAFKCSDIKSVIYSDGRSVEFNQYELDIKDGISENESLIRVTGGLTIRGEIDNAIINGWDRNDGVWIYPLKSRRLFFWVPNAEINKVFGKSRQ